MNLSRPSPGPARSPTGGPIDVCLSVDVEFSVNRALTRPGCVPIGADWVYGPADGRSQGLGFLLDCLDRHRLQATCFVEAFQTYHFGDEPMGRVVADLLAHGQDVQLHLHPVWRYFHEPALRETLARGGKPQDRFSDQTPAQIARWLTAGSEILNRLSGRRPVAFRSGNLDAGRVLFQGMAAAGLRLASNIGVGLSPPTEPELALYAGLHRIDGVTEVPVTSYRRPLSRAALLLLTITGSSSAELRAVCDGAARRGVGPVVILLHPHDFHVALRDDPAAPPRYLPDRIRQGRLERLCRHLAAHPERFRVTTFGAAAERWQAADDTDNPLLPGSLPGLAARFVENRMLPALRRLPQ